MNDYKCIRVVKNANNKIRGYYLLGLNNETDGQGTFFESDVLKDAIRNQRLKVSNLTLTSDNRLMLKKEKAVQKKKVQSVELTAIMQLVAKAKLLGKCQELVTNRGTKCYLVERGLNDYILYIPDDVVTLNHFIQGTLGDFSITRTLQQLKGKLQVIGGSNVASTYRLFNDCLFDSIDVTYFDTSNVNNMYCMFTGCKSNIIGLNKLNTKKVVNMKCMFQFYRGNSLDLSNFDTSNVIDMSAMFRNCYTTELDLSSFDTRRATCMDNMFSDCRAKSINVSSFNTKKVTTMENMFMGCCVNILDLSNFDTREVTKMSGMFARGCFNKLILTSFNTHKVCYMSDMFINSRVPVIDITSFDTSMVTDMSCMFQRCSTERIEFGSGFNTSKVSHTEYMFSSCEADELDLTMCNFERASFVTDMFTDCFARMIWIKKGSKKLKEFLKEHYMGVVNEV